MKIFTGGVVSTCTYGTWCFLGKFLGIPPDLLPKEINFFTVRWATVITTL